MKYVFDIDGTICTQSPSDYSSAKPYQDRIKKINQLYEAGHTILFSTARGMGRNNNDITLANTQFYDLTKRQLEEWGVKYHQLFLGKPAADFYIDDKAVNDEQFFSNLRDTP